MVAATGVLVAAAFYILNLRETTRNRRVVLYTTLMQPFYSKEGQRQGIDLLNMQWSDWDDFYRRYDSTANPENYANRLSIWNSFELIGQMYRQGLLDIETIYGIAPLIMVNMWAKFKPIIEKYRDYDYGSDMFENWESLVGELVKIKARKDPRWRLSKSYFKGDEYERTFNSKAAYQ
jgi:hypothetical protein